MPEDRALLPISALQHLLFCERQCALIHIERTWVENRLTAEGRVLHTRVHKADDETRGALKVSRGLELASSRLGLYGIADVVEFARGTATPIEYKRGAPKKHRADEVQLCAQGMCLEEMLGITVAEGMLFYGRTRRRRRVLFDAALRNLMEETARRLHELITSGLTPKARREPKCDRCSLLAVCLPDILGVRAAAGRYFEHAVQDLLDASSEQA